MIVIQNSHNTNYIHETNYTKHLLIEYTFYFVIVPTRFSVNFTYVSTC